MENVERLLKATVGELDRLLDAKNVLGAPIENDGVTVIPLVSYGFGFASIAASLLSHPYLRTGLLKQKLLINCNSHIQSIGKNR
jgi:hypothetical protein